MNSAQDLLREIDAFLERSGKTQTAFGIETMNNSSFVRHLRQGGSVTLRTVDKIRKFIADHDAAERKRKCRQSSSRAA